MLETIHNSPDPIPQELLRPDPGLSGNLTVLDPDVLPESDLPDEITAPPEKRSGADIAPGVRKHFNSEEIETAKNWEHQHEDQLPKCATYPLVYPETITPVPQRRKKLTPLQAVMGYGVSEEALAAYIEWADKGWSSDALGPLAKKHNLANVLWSLACIDVFFMLAEKMYPDFNRWRFMERAAVYFAQLDQDAKDASWDVIQRRDRDKEVDPDLMRGAEWATINSLRAGKSVYQPVRKKDAPDYGSLKARAVMSESNPTPSAPPTMEGSAFGGWPRLPDANSAVVPAAITRTPLQKECKLLENGLAAYLNQFVPPNWGGQKQKDLVTIVELKKKGSTHPEIAKHLGMSVRTVNNRLNDLRSWAVQPN